MDNRLVCAGIVAAACSIATIAHAQPQPARLIVRLAAGATKSGLTPKARVEKLGSDTGIALRHVREMSLGADVVAVEAASEADVARIAARLAANPDVEFASVDRRRHALQVAPVNDLFAAQQRYLRNDPSAMSAYAAWDITHGSSGIVVAVLDTGYRPHAGLAGRLLPGYDMISDPGVAVDGDGRDADASDPGDFVSASEATADCGAHDSTWHGTSVAGIIGANTNDGAWTAGIDWAARILPVRVLGKCGGYDSDIADGIAWAAGLAVPGAPANPTPAQVINLSLGGTGPCNPIYASAAAAAYGRGTTRAIVAAAGNLAADVADATPANCPGFYAIASTTSSGGLASYSNFGTGIDLSAPGGTLDPRRARANVTVLSNSGPMTPVADDSIANEGGTSFAAPMVAGTISLMLAVAPALTPDQIHAILVTSVKPFPDGSDCTTDRCGAGILDAGAAVRAAAAIRTGAMAPDNYEGLWWNAPAGSESGWGITLAHQDDVIFATWFTYDASGNAWWLSMTALRTAPNAFTGTLYETRGPAFSAVPFDPAAVTHTAVGSGTLTFADDNNGTFAYTVNGIEQAKSITREVFGPLPICTFGALTEPSRATNYQDLWWAAPAASESGRGITLTHQGDTIFATWFTYDVDGSPLWLSATARKTSPGVYTGTLLRTTGPAFNAVPFDPGRVGRTSVGTATFSFGNGDAGSFAYTVNGTAQTKSIMREVLRTPGTLCQ